MPVVTKVVSIDFQSNLAKLMEEYGQLSEEMNKQPEIWAEVAKENKAIAEGFKVMTTLMLAQTALSSKVSAETKKISHDSSSAAFSWQSMARSSKEVYNYVLNATRSLEKWTGIFTAASGMALGASVWGLEKLAAGAGAGRREATGLGLSYGAKRAFDVTYGRFVDSDTLLHGVSTARGDVSSPEARAMFALGMIPGQSGDTAEAAQETLRRVRALAQRTPDTMLGTVSRAYGLDALGYDVEKLRRLKGASDADLQESEYKKRIADFGVSDKALKDMQEFDMALESAGIKIKSTFIELLGPLAPELKALSEGMSDAIKQLLGSQGFKDGIQWVARGLHEFGEYVNKPEFKEDIKILADNIAYAAKKMVEVARFLGILPSGFSPAAREQYQKQHSTPGGSAPGQVMPDNGTKTSGTVGYDASGKPVSLKLPPRDTPMNQSGGVDLGLIAKLEASPDINGRPQISPAGAVGKYQIMPQTAIGLGYDPDDRYDPIKNKEMAQKLINQLSDQYHGNKAEILAAYNGGGAAVDIYRQGGLSGLDSWTNKSGGHPYHETADYLRRAGIVEVTVNNNTGGSAVTSVATAGGVSGPGTAGPSILQ